jgi:dihydrofolate synthase/folylpolyglutamate synthase
MRLDDLAEWLSARTTGGIRWGLERTKELLAGADDPHRRFRSVHVGGTNGKGSVAALCESALRADPAGRRVGLYTSPHLVAFAERIRIDGRPAPDEAILAAAERLLPDIERTGATFFEAATAIAFLCFAEAGVDLAVVEVGLGGRLDSTNVITPLAAAVTNVALEHTQYLGNTLEEIAGEKAGIFKPGIPAITGERNPATLAVLRERAEAAGTRLIELGEQVDRVSTESRLGGSLVRFDSRSWGTGRELNLPLAGQHQARKLHHRQPVPSRAPALGHRPVRYEQIGLLLGRPPRHRRDRVRGEGVEPLRHLPTDSGRQPRLHRRQTRRLHPDRGGPGHPLTIRTHSGKA